MHLVCHPLSTARGRSSINTSRAVELNGFALMTGSKRRLKSAARKEQSPIRNRFRDGENLNVDCNQTLSHCDLGRLGRMHSGAPHHGIDASIRLGCGPDRARSGGVRRAGVESRQVPTVRLGSPLLASLWTSPTYMGAVFVPPQKLAIASG